MGRSFLHVGSHEPCLQNSTEVYSQPMFIFTPGTTHTVSQNIYCAHRLYSGFTLVTLPYEDRRKEIAACTRASLGTESVRQSDGIKRAIWPKELAIYDLLCVLFDSMPPLVNATALGTAEVPQRLL